MLAPVAHVVVHVALGLAAAPAAGTAPAPVTACPDVEWVGFTPTAPYDPAVADVATGVWLADLVVPVPLVAWGVGVASLKGPLPLDATAGQVACAHSVGLALCGPPLLVSGIGAPLILLETAWIAPVSVLNALDRDVKCARARQMPSPSPSPSPPSPSSPLPSLPPAQRSDPLPPPPPVPGAPPAPLSMAF